VTFGAYCTICLFLSLLVCYSRMRRASAQSTSWSKLLQILQNMPQPTHFKAQIATYVATDRTIFAPIFLISGLDPQICRLRGYPILHPPSALVKTICAAWTVGLPIFKPVWPVRLPVGVLTILFLFSVSIFAEFHHFSSPN